MKNISLVIVFTVCCTFALQKGNLARFHRILKGYQYSDYRESDRDISLNYWYNTQRDDDVPEEPDITYESRIDQSFSRNMNGDLGALGRWTHSSPVRRTDHTLKLLGGGALHENSYVRYNELLGIFDTSANRRTVANGSLNYQIQHEKQFGFENMNGWPLKGITGQFVLSGGHSRFNDFRHSNDYFITSKEVDQTFELDMSAEPFIGVGKKKPVKPVYQAFLIEDKLKKTGAIKSNLSDSTIYKISALIGSLRAYELKHDRYTKYFMKSLQNILQEDSSTIDSSLHAYTLFKVHEVFTPELPIFYTGFSARLLMRVEVDSKWISSYNDTAVFGPDFNFDVEYGSFVQFDWTYPVFSRFFISLGLRSPLSIWSQDDWLKAIEGNAVLYYLLLDRMILEGGIEVWNNSYTKESNINGYFTAYFYIEDRVSLRCTMQKNFSKDIYKFEGATIYRFKNREQISLGLNYDF